jgi:hypothetical protein
MVKTTNQLVTNHCESWESLGIINYQQLATIYQLAQDFASIHSSYGSHGPFGFDETCSQNKTHDQMGNTNLRNH